MYGVEDFRSGHPVDGGMVHLQQDGEAVRGQVLHAVEPFDDIGLPQRPSHIQGSRMQPRHENAQLAPVAGLRQRDMAHVEFEVEIPILDPVGSIQAKGVVAQLAPEHRRLVKIALENAQDVPEPDLAAGRRGLIVKHDRGDVQRRAVALHLHEAVVHFGELFHGGNPSISGA